jgi:hypothetical protein
MAKTKQRRFYRSNLSTIVWDPSENSPMADFSEGHFTTDSPEVAARLEELGYPEIGLNETEPPAVTVNQPTTVLTGNIPIMRGTPPEKLMEDKMKNAMEEVGGPAKTKAKKPVVAKKAQANAEKKAKPRAKKAPTKRLPRRRAKKKED